MRLLLDTHVLIWVGNEPAKLSDTVRELITRQETEVYFSVVSLWEIAVKRNLKRMHTTAFNFDPRVLRDGALAIGFRELTVTSHHVLEVEQLPRLHGDPFDHLLLCQSIIEDLQFVTRDKKLFEYPAHILRA